MKSILILGAGNIGEAIAFDLSDEYDIYIADTDKERLKKLEQYGETKILDVSDEERLKNLIERYDLVIGALPGRYGFYSVEKAIESKTDIVDVSFMPEDPFILDKKAKENECTVIVDAGFGPGMSNVFMGKISKELEKIEDVFIRIGGLPKDPEPPLFYKVTWSPSDLIEEYTRPARMIEEGEMVEVDPFEDIKSVELKGNKFEEFYSDGLRTLLHTLPDVKNMKETTLRWKGHLNKMKILRELGFFDESNLEETLNVIVPHMRFESRDFSIMDILAEGISDDERKKIHYFFYDEADEKFSSMSRTTGFTTSTIARMVLEEDLDKGVLAPEHLGMDDDHYQYIVNRMKDKGIQIETSKE